MICGITVIIAVTSGGIGTGWDEDTTVTAIVRVMHEQVLQGASEGRQRPRDEISLPSGISGEREGIRK